MGVEKGVVKEGTPKNIFWTLPKLQKCPNQFGTDNAQKKGCLFLGFLPSYYMSIEHCCSLLIEQSSKSSLEYLDREAT